MRVSGRNHRHLERSAIKTNIQADDILGVCLLGIDVSANEKKVIVLPKLWIKFLESIVIVRCFLNEQRHSKILPYREKWIKAGRLSPGMSYG